MGVGPVGFSVEQQNLLWVMWRRGDSIREMERTLGETLPRIRRFCVSGVGFVRFRGSAGPVIWPWSSVKKSHVGSRQA
jgi:hypothetical protein